MATDVCQCGCCNTSAERVRYFSRQLLTADDMTTEQHYFREKMRRHNRFLHGFGVVCGLEVVPATDAEGKKDAYPWRVQVCPGYAVGPQGDEIEVCEPVCFNIDGPWLQPHDPCVQPWPCPPTGSMPSPGREQPVYLAIRYAKCDSRPVRVHPVGCACDESACEISRIRDDFEMALLWELPDCYSKVRDAEEKWCGELRAWREGGRESPMPLPACMPCCDTPWVILATIRLPAIPNAPATGGTLTPITAAEISHRNRRALLSTSSLQNFANCLLL